jgi:hypothetical protein
VIFSFSKINERILCLDQAMECRPVGRFPNLLLGAHLRQLCREGCLHLHCECSGP